MIGESRSAVKSWSPRPTGGALALIWFLAVYHLAPSRRIAARLPRPPRAWSALLIAVMAPPLVVWGLFCAGMLIRSAGNSAEVPGGESTIFSNFPFVMMVAAILLIVTGRTIRAPRPAFLAAGLIVAALYVLIWMFNGKRSHSLIGVLATICALYITRLKRPLWPALVTTAFAGALVVTIAIGWRNDRDHERSIAGFGGFLADFDISRILQNLNVADADEEFVTYESEEYGGFLLMMDTVPAKSDFDYGENYLRVFSTFIPRRPLAFQAGLWPRRVDQRLDRRLGVETRRGFHRTGDQPPGCHAAQRRCGGDRDRRRLHGPGLSLRL